MHWKFDLISHGQRFTVETPDGMIDYESVLNTLQLYENYTIVGQDTVPDRSESTRSGWWPF